LTQAQATIAQYETQTTDLSTQLEAITVERDAAKARSKQVEQDLEALHGDLQTLQTETIESREEATRRRGQLDELALQRDRQVGEHQEKMSALEAAHAVVVAEWEEKVTELERQVEDARQTQSRQETEIHNLLEKVTELQASLTTADETKNACLEQLEQLQGAHTELEVRGCARFGSYRSTNTTRRPTIRGLRQVADT
jgi:chromosome segregation ATPase